MKTEKPLANRHREGLRRWTWSDSMLNRLHILGVRLHRGGLGGRSRGCLSVGIIRAGGQGDEADGGETDEDQMFHAHRRAGAMPTLHVLS